MVMIVIIIMIIFKKRMMNKTDISFNSWLNLSLRSSPLSLHNCKKHSKQQNVYLIDAIH